MGFSIKELKKMIEKMDNVAIMIKEDKAVAYVEPKKLETFIDDFERCFKSLILDEDLSIRFEVKGYLNFRNKIGVIILEKEGKPLACEKMEKILIENKVNESLRSQIIEALYPKAEKAEERPLNLKEILVLVALYLLGGVGTIKNIIEKSRRFTSGGHLDERSVMEGIANLRSRKYILVPPPKIKSLTLLSLLKMDITKKDKVGELSYQLACDFKEVVKKHEEEFLSWAVEEKYFEDKVTSIDDLVKILEEERKIGEGHADAD